MTAPGPFFSTTSENSRYGPPATHSGPSSETNEIGLLTATGVPAPASSAGAAGLAAVAGAGKLASSSAQADAATASSTDRTPTRGACMEAHQITRRHFLRRS